MNKKLGTIKSYSKTVFATLLGLISFLLMASIVWQYRTGDLQMDFLISKQEYIHLLSYRVSFYVHIFSSLWVLPTGLILLSPWVLKQFPKTHRQLGKFYILIILGLAAPSGLFMSLFANGDIVSKTNFVMLSIAWWLVTYLGYKTIKLGKVAAHRKWMMRSVALSYSAITLRILQLLFGQLALFHPEEQYLYSSVLSWSINLLLVELYFGFKSKKIHFANRLLVTNQKMRHL